MVNRSKSTGRGGERKKRSPPKKSNKKTVDKAKTNGKARVVKITEITTGKNITPYVPKITPSKTQTKCNDKSAEENITPTTTNAQYVQAIAPVNRNDTLKTAEKTLKKPVWLLHTSPQYLTP